jgi:hypothetical protein
MDPLYFEMTNGGMKSLTKYINELVNNKWSVQKSWREENGV